MLYPSVLTLADKFYDHRQQRHIDRKFDCKPQVVKVHGIQANNPGKELVVDNMLVHGAHDPPSLLEQPLVLPVWVELLKDSGNPVVLPQVDCVHRRQRRLLARPVVPGNKAVARLSLAFLALLRRGHQVLAATVRRQSDVEAPAGELSEVVGVADVLTVDLRRVQERRVLVQLLPRSCGLKVLDNNEI